MCFLFAQRAKCGLGLLGTDLAKAGRSDVMMPFIHQLLINGLVTVRPGSAVALSLAVSKSQTICQALACFFFQI